MQKRPYKITLEKIKTSTNVQHFDQNGNATTCEVVDKIEYEITSIQNLITVEMCGGEFRAGDRIPEHVAKILCEAKCYDVKVTR